MILIGGLIIILGFIIFIKFFGVIEKSTEVINIAKSATTIVRNKVMDDHQKEVEMKKYSKKLDIDINGYNKCYVNCPRGSFWACSCSDEICK